MELETLNPPNQVAEQIYKEGGCSIGDAAANTFDGHLHATKNPDEFNNTKSSNQPHQIQSLTSRQLTFLNPPLNESDNNEYDQPNMNQTEAKKVEDESERNDENGKNSN